MCSNQHEGLIICQQSRFARCNKTDFRSLQSFLFLSQNSVSNTVNGESWLFPLSSLLAPSMDRTQDHSMTSPPKKLGFEFSRPLGPGEGSALHCYIILYIRYSKTQSIGNLSCCTCRRFYPCRLQSLKQSTIATCARNRASGLLPVPGRASCKLRVNLLHVQYSR